MSALSELFHRLSLRHHTRRRARAALTLGGIALGTALLTAVRLIDASVSESFRGDVSAISGQAELTVTAGDSGFAESEAEKLQGLPGIASVLPLVEAHTAVLGSAGKRAPLEILGLDLTDSESLKAYQKGMKSAVRDWIAFLSQPDSLLVTRRFAGEHALAAGSRVEVFAPAGERALTVRGIVPDEGPALAFGGAIAFMDIDAARLAFGREGKIDRINLTLSRGADASQATRAASERLGPAYSVERADEQGSELEASVRAFELLLGFFGALSLLIALLLVAHSLTSNLLERRSELGTLRALGATRGQLLALLLAEALALGAAGSLLGALAGVAAARALARSAAHAMSIQAQSRVPLAHLALSARALGLPFAAGVATSLLAVLLAAVRLSLTPPLELLERSRQPLPRSRAGGWVPSLVAGALLLAWAPILRRLAPEVPAAHAAALALVEPASAFLGALLAGAALSQALLVFATRRAARPPRRPAESSAEPPRSADERPQTTSADRPLTARLALANLARSGSQVRRNVMSLMVGLTLVVLVGTARDSFRATLEARFDSTLREDLIVSSTGNLVSGRIQAIDEAIGPEISRIPGVDSGAPPQSGAYGLRVSRTRYQGSEVGIKAFDEPGPAIRYANFAVTDRPAAEAGRELYHSLDPTTFVSDTFALRFGARTGDTLRIETPRGPRPLRVVGVVSDFSAGGGYLIMSRDRFKELWNDSQVTGFGIQVRKGADVDEVRRLIEERIARPRGLTVTSSRELRRQMLGAIDDGFGSLGAVELAALLAGILGVVNAGLVGMMERRGEIAMLRALGMKARGVSRMVLAETLIQGMLAAVFAAGFGLWIARDWITRSLTGSFGWLVSFHPSWGSIALAFGAGLAASTAASYWPARQAARIPVVEALKHE